MKLGLLVMILCSVTLSAVAQILLKYGMSRPAMQQALGGPLPQTLWVVATSPGVIGGLFVFGISVLTWLYVLSRVDVSYAYPFVSLGMVLTVASGWLILGEQVPVARILGLGLIIAGVMVVAVTG